jgi:hypothetical protein
VLVALCYAQALFGILPIVRKDPFARLLATGFSGVARQVEGSHPAAVLTTDYETTAWFAFYGHLPVVQLNEEKRWPDAPQPSKGLLREPLIYIAPQGRDRRFFVASHFGIVARVASIDRVGRGRVVEHYDVYRVAGLRGPGLGRMP